MMTLNESFFYGSDIGLSGQRNPNSQSVKRYNMSKLITPVKERDNKELLELVCQLHFRALQYPSKEMHDAYIEAREELESRLSLPPAAKNGEAEKEKGGDVELFSGFTVVFVKDAKMEKGRALMMLHPDDYETIKNKNK